MPPESSTSTPGSGAPQRFWFCFAAVIALLCSTSYAAAAEVHVVAKGHTLGKIAKRYNVSIETLREVNGIEGNSIKPGQRLVIPEPGALADAKHQANKLQKAAEASRSQRNAAAASNKLQSEYQRRPKRRGFVHIQSNGQTLKTQLVTGGRVSPAALKKLRDALKHRSGPAHDIHPDLAKHLAKVSDNFGGRAIVVTSGYRPKTDDQFTPHSNHNQGRAIDFRIEGVPVKVLWEFCRELSGAGAGYYPTSGFVHLDSRGASHAWVDISGAGEPPNYVSVASVSGVQVTPAPPPQLANKSGGNQNTTSQNSIKSRSAGQADPTRSEDRLAAASGRKKTHAKRTPN